MSLKKETKSLLTCFFWLKGIITTAFSLIRSSPRLIFLVAKSPMPFPSRSTALNGLQFFLWLFQSDFWHARSQYWTDPQAAHWSKSFFCSPQYWHKGILFEIMHRVTFAFYTRHVDPCLSIWLLSSLYRAHNGRMLDADCLILAITRHIYWGRELLEFIPHHKRKQAAF